MCHSGCKNTVLSNFHKRLLEKSKSINYFEQTIQKWFSVFEGVRDANNMWLDEEMISLCQRIGDYVPYIQITCTILGDEHQIYSM